VSSKIAKKTTNKGKKLEIKLQLWSKELRKRLSSDTWKTLYRIKI
jgi:hypothetical protein